MTTITLEEAINRAPAIGATQAGVNSDTYQFISTRRVLEKALENNWEIVGASAAGRSPSAQHRVTLVHSNDLARLQHDPNCEGIPRMELFNSHNLSKRFMCVAGFFKVACSNGLIISYGPVESIRTKHRFSDNRLETIMGHIETAAQHFPALNGMIESFKQREMTEEEQLNYAKFAIKGRYLYRKQLPKAFGNLELMSEKLVTTIRRPEDEGDKLWQVYNRVQENIVRGIAGTTRPMRGYDDSIRVNRLLWKGAEAALESSRDRYSSSLEGLLIKQNQQPTPAQLN